MIFKLFNTFLVANLKCSFNLTELFYKYAVKILLNLVDIYGFVNNLEER